MQKSGETICNWDLIGGYCITLIYFLMELNNQLQVLTDRAGALHDQISDRIHGSSCLRFCPKHGHCCGTVTETPLEGRERERERESLIAIRDSLENVENTLVFLQKLKSWQQKDRSAAIRRLEESRLILMEKVTPCRVTSLRSPDSLFRELNAYFGDSQTACDWNLKRMIQRMTESKKANPNCLMNCIRSLINPWSWHKTAAVAVKLILVSASIASTLGFYRARQELGSDSGKGILSFVDSTARGRKGFLLKGQKSPLLDVLHGRG